MSGENRNNNNNDFDFLTSVGLGGPRQSSSQLGKHSKKSQSQIGGGNGDPNAEELEAAELELYEEYKKKQLARSHENNPYMRDITQAECDEFQKRLDTKYIQHIWKSFRENSDNGKISRPIFKKVFVNFIDEKVRDNFLDAIFERFRLEKLSEKYDDPAFASISNESEQIDIQDLVISLTILARMSEEQKLKLIFTLTDVDEDECLSTEDIRRMIQRIERNFTKEQCHINSESSCLAHEFALNKSQRRFEWTIYNLGAKLDAATAASASGGVNSSTVSGAGNGSNGSTQTASQGGATTGGNGNQSSLSNASFMKPQLQNNAELDENKLITWEEFIECLNKKQHLKRRFLPNNFLLYHCLKNTPREREYHIHSDSANDFDMFRRLIHMKLRNFYEKEYTQAYAMKEKGIRFPGKIKLDQQVERKSDLLPNYQKASDMKKLHTLVKDFKANSANQQKNFIDEQLKKMETQEDSFAKQFGTKPENSNNLKKFVEILDKIRAMKVDEIHVKQDETNPSSNKR